MKKIICFLLTLSLAFSFIGSAFAADEKVVASFIYVSPNGSDTADGSIKTPYKTLEKAIEAAKAYNSTVVINLREGEYPLSGTIEINSDNSDLVIRGFMGENAVVTGGTPIPYSEFSKTDDTDFLNSLSDSSVKDKIVSVNLKNLGIEDLGKIRIQGFFGDAEDQGFASTLSYKGNPLTIARYPNDSYLKTDYVTSDGTDNSTLYYGSLAKTEFYVTDTRYRNWAKNDLWVFGYFKYDWADTTAPCSVSTLGKVTTYVSPSCGVAKSKRFYFFNVPEEIDMPGEWYLNRDTGVLYLYPTSDMAAGEDLIFTTMNTPLFDISGASNISFENMHITGTSSNAVRITDSKNISVNNCEISNIGDTAITVTRSTYCGIENSYIHNLGSGGVFFNRCGDRYHLTSSGCYVKNCEFEKFSQYKRTYSPAVKDEFSVGIYFGCNKIHNSPHFAIEYKANDDIIEYNEIYDVCKETRDCGAVYAGRHWETWGNEFRYNYVHDLTADSSATDANPVHGIYLDDMDSATRVHGNVFYNVPSVSLMGGGRNNQFTNNVMIDCGSALSFDQRAANTPNPSSPNYCEYDGKAYSWGVEVNMGDLKNSPYKDSVEWKGKYVGFAEFGDSSALVNILDDNPEIPKYNIIRNNVKYNTNAGGIAELVKTYGAVSDDFVISSESSFKNYSSKDFELTDDALSIISQELPDFEKIDFNSIGVHGYIYEDKYESRTLVAGSMRVQQNNYLTYQKMGEEKESKHGIYTYVTFSGDPNDVSSCGINFAIDGWKTVKLASYLNPTANAYVIGLVGDALVPGSYTVSSYIIDKSGNEITGDEASVVIDKKTYVKSWNNDGRTETVYEIEEF